MQVIKYRWFLKDGVYEPSFFVAGGAGISRISLLGRNITAKIGRRLCTGYFRNGVHIKCQHNCIAAEAKCNECMINDSFFMCMKCDGSECINTKQRSSCMGNMYYIYLAAFDSVLKVGISYQFRLKERLIEQGADFGAKIASVKDGKDVRKIEQEIMKELNIIDRLSGSAKHRFLFGNPNKSVESILSAVSLLRNNGISRYMIPVEIYDLREHYGLDNVPYEPRRLAIDEDYEIKGTSVAAKGNLIIFENKGDFFTVNAHELLGREIEIR